MTSQVVVKTKQIFKFFSKSHRIGLIRPSSGPKLNIFILQNKISQKHMKRGFREINKILFSFYHLGVLSIDTLIIISSTTTSFNKKLAFSYFQITILLLIK